MVINKVNNCKKREPRERKIKMENLKLTPKILSKISMTISKMGISSLILEINVESGDEEKDKEMVVKKLLALVIDNLYKAEEEIVSLISEIKEISIEEAAKEDVIPIIKDLLNNEKLKSFLKLS